MRHFFVARHGVFGRDFRINNTGRMQMEVLADAMKPLLNHGSVYIISSTEMRARDSSQLLAARLCLPAEVEYDPYLYCANPSLDTLMRLVDGHSGRADALVMMTHSEIGRDFPSYFLYRELGVEERLGPLDQGKAWHFDLEHRTYMLLP